MVFTIDRDFSDGGYGKVPLDGGFAGIVEIPRVRDKRSLAPKWNA
jgi:hypothetical protein